MPEPDMSRKGVRFTALRAVEADLGRETVCPRRSGLWKPSNDGRRCAAWRPRRSRQPSKCHTTNPTTSNVGGGSSLHRSSQKSPLDLEPVIERRVSVASAAVKQPELAIRRNGPGLAGSSGEFQLLHLRRRTSTNPAWPDRSRIRGQDPPAAGPPTRRGWQLRHRSRTGRWCPDEDADGERGRRPPESGALRTDRC